MAIPPFRRALAILALAISPVLVAGCGGSAKGAEADQGTTLTVYSDQHADLINAVTAAYTKETGVKFKIQQDATVGQIEAEGDSTPADIFLSEDPAPVAQLDSKKLLSPIAKDTLDQVQPGLSAGDGYWVAYAARARVLYYNPKKISEADLPKSLADIVEPRYKGLFAWAPSGAFVATTQYLLSSLGVDKTTAFLKGIKANGVDEHKNGNVRDTVEAGKHAMGLSNHYYWWVLAAQRGGPDHLTSKIYHFPSQDPGNLVLSSGAGVLKSSRYQEQSANFVKWLTAKDGGQKILTSDDIQTSEAQYPAANGTSSPVVGGLSDIKSPHFDMNTLSDQTQAADLLKSLGMSS